MTDGTKQTIKIIAMIAGAAALGPIGSAIGGESANILLKYGEGLLNTFSSILSDLSAADIEKHLNKEKYSNNTDLKKALSAAYANAIQFELQQLNQQKSVYDHEYYLEGLKECFIKAQNNENILNTIFANNGESVTFDALYDLEIDRKNQYKQIWNYSQDVFLKVSNNKLWNKNSDDLKELRHKLSISFPKTLLNCLASILKDDNFEKSWKSYQQSVFTDIISINMALKIDIENLKIEQIEQISILKDQIEKLAAEELPKYIEKMTIAIADTKSTVSQIECVVEKVDKNTQEVKEKVTEISNILRNAFNKQEDTSIELVLNKWKIFSCSVKHDRILEIQNRPFSIPSPLMEPWNKFIGAVSWADSLYAEINNLVLGGLDTLISEGYGYLLQITREVKERQKVLFSDPTRPYKHIEDNLMPYISNAILEVKKLLIDDKTTKKNSKIKSLLFRLEAVGKILQGSYNKVFLYTGTLGAGKTHFIASLYEKYKDEIIFIYLDMMEFKVDIESTVISIINSGTGGNFESIQDLLKFIQDNKSSVKLVIVIDDLHKWLDFGILKISELKRIIINLSGYISLHWLVAIQVNYLEQVDADGEFWQKYCYKGIPSLPNVCGWVVLDDLNKEQKIGYKILKECYGIKETLASDISKNNNIWLQKNYEWLSEDENKKQLEIAYSPYITWLLLEFKDKISFESMVNLHYISFIKKLVNRRISFMVNTYGIEKDISEPTIIKSLEEISQYVFEKFSLKYKYNDLLEYLHKILSIRTNGLSESIIQTFIYGDLFEKVKQIEKTILWDKSEYYLLLRSELIWEFLTAKNFYEYLENNTMNFEILFRKLESSFQGTQTKSFQEATLELLLLIVDVFADKIEDYDKSLQSFILSINEINYLPNQTLWFAGVKSSNRFKNILFSIDCTENMKRDKRVFFSYMFFICEAYTMELSEETRLSKLHPFFSEIKEHNLVSYFSYLVKKIFQRIEDSEITIRCMLRLTNCEVLDIQQELARVSFETLIRIFESQYDLMISNILLYLRSLCKEHNCNEVFNNKKSKRYFYYEYIINELCNFLAIEENCNAYYILYKNSWYEKDESIIESIRTVMKKEISIALGRKYRNSSDEYRRDYLNIVKKLMQEKATAFEKKLAFHFIKHTEGEDEKKVAIVGKEFKAFLINIRRDVRLKKHVEDEWKDMLIANLGQDYFRFDYKNTNSYSSKRHKK